ncbi:MAG: hypothetical protein ABJA37_13880 [Ferruginibacter sp.]
MAQALIKAGLAQKFPYGANWVQYNITDQQNAAHAVWIFKLDYDVLEGADDTKLLKAIAGCKGACPSDKK